MSNSDSKNPGEDSGPTYKRIISGSGETIVPENLQSEIETKEPEESETGSGFRLPEEFTLVRRLGRGGMGEVYLVERDSGFNREQLALKTILPEHFGNEGAIERFKREISTLLRLRHDHIVQLRDFRLYRGYYYFLMEYIEGVTLQERVAKQGVFTASEVLDVFGRLAQALDYAHGKGVIHRDLKPSNIMLGPKGAVYLLDFGIARHQESENTITRRMGPGTWEYMSPEQFDDDDPSASMDVYGLGATIYFALTGTHPFDATALRKLILQKDKGCPDVSKLGLPAGMVEGLRLGLHPEPSSRPKSCRELLDLMRAVAGKKTSGAKVSSVERQETKPSPVLTKPVASSDPKPVVSGEAQPAAKPITASSGLMLPEEFTNSLGMKFRLIKPGTFLMGSPAKEANRSSYEFQHQVTLTQPFYMGIYPVTQSEYQEVMGSNPSYFKGDLLPVENVSWEDASAFIENLNGLSQEKSQSRVYRLPTEAQWEYACRAGSSTAYCFGDDASRLGDYAWYSANSSGKTHPVGQMMTNAWGMYDMHGNVLEWCSDSCGDYPKGYTTDPTGPRNGFLRVRRGGCWNYQAADCRSSSRLWNLPSDRYSHLGFRLILSSQGT